MYLNTPIDCRWSMCTLVRCSMWMETRLSPHPLCKFSWQGCAHIAPHIFVSIDLCLFFSSSRSSSYPFSDSPLYSQTPPTSSSTFYESTPSSESDITGSVTSQPVSVATAGANSGTAAAGGGGYVIQGGYVLGGGGAAGGGGGQSYSSPNSRAPPATVSTKSKHRVDPTLKRNFTKFNCVTSFLGAVAVR